MPRNHTFRRSHTLTLTKVFKGWCLAYPKFRHFTHVLDLACGSGEVTCALENWLVSQFGN
jgi:ubiquinone/menaquinone biosynthesis C-methylase UbiE